MNNHRTDQDAAGMRRRRFVATLGGAVGAGMLPWRWAHAAPPALPFAPDIVVAKDGSGHFTSVHEAVQSIGRDNRERKLVLVKNGEYAERVNVDAPYVTLRGESRQGVRIAFNRDSSQPRDERGVSVLDISARAHDFVLENLTVHNTFPTIGVHAFAVQGRADRVIIQDCDLISLGADTLAMWRSGKSADEAGLSSGPGASPLYPNGGRYYHTRLKVTGAVDFICPRGWCYMSDSVIVQVNPKAEAAMWHDGHGDPDKKFVIKACTFDGPPQWFLARHHVDAQLYFVDCTFSERMRDRAPYRVVYPLDGSAPTPANLQKNRELDKSNLHGERHYFSNSHRSGGDYAWQRDNLETAAGKPAPKDIGAKWTFAGSWDPERVDGPAVISVQRDGAGVALVFDRLVSVKGRPELVFSDGARAPYLGGSGSNALRFAHPAGAASPLRLAFDRGSIIGSEAVAAPRLAAAVLPQPTAG